MTEATPEVPIDRFAFFAEGLDHPEGLAFDNDGNLWAGGEAGQIHRINSEGKVKTVTTVGRFNLGLTFSERQQLYVCNFKLGALLQNSAAHVAAKHGLLGLTRAMGLDYAQKRIRVNCVCPGAIDTPMLRWAVGLDPNPEKVLQACDRIHAMGRMGKAQEVAKAIAFLASPSASFITGATLLVDGGMLVPLRRHGIPALKRARLTAAP